MMMEADARRGSCVLRTHQRRTYLGVVTPRQKAMTAARDLKLMSPSALRPLLLGGSPPAVTSNATYSVF